MSTITPSPRTWTLRFKHNRTTVLVHADPLQKWPLVRADLLRALHQTHPDGRLHGVTIPAHPHEVLLAKPVDPNDLSLGWEGLEGGGAGRNGFEEGEEEAERSSVGKGKGKAVGAIAARGSKTAKDAGKDCPQGAGLRDGSVLAFKFREGSTNVKGKGKTPQDETDALDGDTLVDELEPEVWDVVVPSMEETYEDEDELADADEGVEMER